MPGTEVKKKNREEKLSSWTILTGSSQDAVDTQGECLLAGFSWLSGSGDTFMLAWMTLRNQRLKSVTWHRTPVTIGQYLRRAEKRFRIQHVMTLMESNYCHTWNIKQFTSSMSHNQLHKHKNVIHWTLLWLSLLCRSETESNYRIKQLKETLTILWFTTNNPSSNIYSISHGDILDSEGDCTLNGEWAQMEGMWSGSSS